MSLASKESVERAKNILASLWHHSITADSPVKLTSLKGVIPLEFEISAGTPPPRGTVAKCGIPGNIGYTLCVLLTGTLHTIAGKAWFAAMKLQASLLWVWVLQISHW